MSTGSRFAALIRFDLPTYLELTRSTKGGRLFSVLDSILAFLKKCETSPYNFPWFYYGCSDPIRTLHGLRYRQAGGSGSRNLQSVLRVLLWPFVSIVFVIGFTARNGKCVRNHFGVSIARQIAESLYATYRYNSAPSDYYLLHLFNRPKSESILLYFAQREKDEILNLLQPRSKHISVVNNKIRFYEHCIAEGLPTPEIIAAFSGEPDDEIWYTPNKDLPNSDLFRKPPGLFGASGAQLWRFDEATKTWNNKGVSLDQGAFLENCRQRNCILQPVLRNHAGLRDLAPHGLATFRVVTILSPSTGPAVLGALLKIPVGELVIDA